MEPYDRARDNGMRPIFFPMPSSGDASGVQPGPSDDMVDVDQDDGINVAFKGPKRKRLAKACDACHKSKRRCDGTAPCSNCYFASKKCTYTDASGRPVPAPRPLKQDRAEPSPDNSEQIGMPPAPAESWAPQQPPPTNTYNPYSVEAPTSRMPVDPSRAPADQLQDDRGNARKRFRSDSGAAGPPSEPILRNPQPNFQVSNARQYALDPALTRELVNLFFAHCHPHCMIIHKPTFSVALAQNLVPAHLLNAICALSAPLSKQPHIRTSPPRFAGRPFAQEALSMMFDSGGRLLCEANLATAQTLCLLQTQELITAQPTWTTRCHELALQVLDRLEVRAQHNPMLTPVPSSDFMQSSIEKECVRRVFWFIYLLDVMTSVFMKRSISLKENELMLRLPVDETSFDLAAHSTLSVPEYLFQPAPRTAYASELGHLIRVFTIYAKIEVAVDAYMACDVGSPHFDTVMELDKTLEAWKSTLPDHLLYSAETLQIQLSMFETSSNAGAWCFFIMHVVYASCSLALNAAKQRAQRGVGDISDWAVKRVKKIIDSLGSRARHSALLGTAIWPLMKYSRADDPHIIAKSAENEEIWGMRVEDYVSITWYSQQERQPAPPGHLLPLGPPPVTHPQSQTSDPLSRHQRQFSASASTFPSLGRSFHDLRLHNRPSQSENRGVVGNESRVASGDPRILTHDAEIDPALQGGSGSRNHVLGDGPQSLPSLKASGLLDSWSSPGDVPSGSGVVPLPWAATPSRPDAQQASLQRRSSPRNNAPHPLNRTDLDPSRPSTSGMPVGLQWLAHESSVPRPT